MNRLLKIRSSKKGVYFTFDAIFASSIILISVLVIYPLLNSPERPSYINSDLMIALSSLKVGEINNSYVASLVSDGRISNLNKSVLEQIGEFYVFNESLAREMTDSIFQDIGIDSNFGLWFGPSLVASNNDTLFEVSERISSFSQIISGIKEGESVTAYSGRAFLSNSLQNDYFYFGGYVGEGNISVLIEYHGVLNSVTMEAAVREDFDLYVNSIYSGSYEGGSSFVTPTNYTFPIDNFNSGINTLNFVASNLSIAGGFIKTTYAREVTYNSNGKYHFPGIEGIINLYDGIGIPLGLSEMNVYLKFNSSRDVFLTLGNITIYRGNTSGVEEINLNDSYLSSLLDYSALEGKTVPLRLGIENLTYVSTGYREADVFSVTDLSGSMGDCGTYAVPYMCNYDCRVGSKRCQVASPSLCTGTPCGGTCRTPRDNYFVDCAQTLVQAAISSNKAFIDIILNHTGNRAGLVGYRSSVSSADFHNLSSNNVSLKAEADSWYASGNTCICCGINRAVDELVANSEESRFRSLIVMSDGEANVQCSRQGTGSSKNDAIEAACDAAELGITVYSIGFGQGADEATLQAIAACGNGSYYYSSVDGLEEIYANVTEEVLSAAFFEQQLLVEGQISTRLFPESYISFDYPLAAATYGLITSTEKSFDSIYGGSFSIPANSTLLSARVISYSGSRWTNELLVNGVSAYNLSRYGSDYIDLGDPYSINLPLSSLLSTLNIINLTTGVSPANSSGGSLSNKIIYTLARNVSVYSGLSGFADGCEWHLEFEDGSHSNFLVPGDYSGLEDCYYEESGQNVSSDQDAVQVAVMKLFEALDYDSDGLLDVKFTDQDLQISSSELSGIPYDWSTKVQVRTWR